MTATIPADRWKSTSADATQALGRTLGQALVGGLTIGLVGPLGAGKTQLVKGIAVGNGLDDADQVTSPTFTLVHEYPGTLPLYHLDAYRLSQPRELIALGFDEMTRADAAVVIEWADRVRPAMPEDILWIELAIVDETTREVSCCARGPISSGYLDAVRTTRR